MSGVALVDVRPNKIHNKYIFIEASHGDQLGRFASRTDHPTKKDLQAIANVSRSALKALRRYRLR